MTRAATFENEDMLSALKAVRKFKRVERLQEPLIVLTSDTNSTGNDTIEERDMKPISTVQHCPINANVRVIVCPNVPTPPTPPQK